ncbi:hypothetical protein MPTK1_1g00220 [Marchantia polymorpha subsp. ruderalis]|uniref:Transmembrane protein 135 N-terminal domain-containing protein n=2 Tax=Marchantia polymorpha TaxID=3197 RepID=A0A176WPV3_MARPO|nr:hypothetical protein AXG93_4461s1160 [Marchantia polymorpha subsp. ruderalis]PTQ32096.1 hypothetical protein MARPO_0103s0064 [Marchantia polymorpha]BBM96732.1 hypothetical protein Mp_1g00220 [Marchantia polymorpha subsp. ruderalis]|eukprot:PTQ32096.1 hypothetical protein MARPO_0103s0064 [Marchantia polymorpha]
MSARGIASNGGSLGPLVLNSISVEERAARATYEKAEAEKRLLEAEVRLREAIAELHKNQKKKATYSTLFSGRHPLCQHGDSCVANSVGSLCQSFMLAYGVRVGIGVLLRAFKLARKRPYYSFLDLKLLLGENNLIVREEACRTGLLFGGFTGCFHAIRCFLRRKSGTDSPLNVFLAGGVAGLSILALDDSQRRRTFALYLLARVAQCAYNSAKAKNKFHFWGSQWQHGDTLLFALACAQIMYAYVMRPETLPDSYNEFIVKTGPIARPVLKAVRESCRGGGIDVASLAAFVTSKTGLPMFGVHAHSPIIPCSAVHPDTASCLAHNTRATRATFKKTFPLYLSLTFVPFVVLNIQKFMEAPIHTFWNALKSAVRSTSFLSAFVGVYQGVICVQRKLVTKDHKSVYFFAGAIAALSALLEKKSRRSELALYTLPRAADSLWYTLVNRHLLPDLKHAEVALFCLCMGGVMYYHEYEPDTMAPFLRGLIRRFLNRTGTPDQTLDSSLRHQPSIAAEGSQESSTHPSSQYSTHDHGSSARSLSPKNAQPGPDPADAAAKLQAEAFEGL